MGFKPHFLVVSLGNPLPKYPSLHSAGHFALNGLVPALHHPEFTHTTLGGQKALVSQGPKYTLVQSPTLMNVSGTFVGKAWREMLRQHDPSSLSLVIVHDEMELKFGSVRLTAWDRSHKGHNGIRSVKKHLSQEKYPDSPFVRMALGIGRPLERDPDTVSKYVLAPVSQEQRLVLEEEVPTKVAQQLIKLEAEWSDELQK